MAKRSTTKATREPIYVGRGANWHITYDRTSGDFCAIHDDAGLLGIFGGFDGKQQAQRAIDDYNYEAARRGQVAA